jgi:hypothetical protein
MPWPEREAAAATRFRHHAVRFLAEMALRDRSIRLVFTGM